MANLFDYINWRKDLTMAQDPFNDIDGLILSELIYVEFEQFIPLFPTNQSITLKEAANIYFASVDVDALLAKFSFTKEAIELFKEMAKAPRYQNIRLSNYINELDYQEIKQFSAITYQLEDNSVFVAYRGTDDTILGWQEDFQMTYRFPVASQIRSHEYLETIAEIKFPIRFNGFTGKFFNKTCQYLKYKMFGVNLRIGGHSKGANLAVYASSNVSSKIAKRIIEVYNYDGPGFSKEVLANDQYQSIALKTKKFIPEGSVFGIMLESLEKRVIIKSVAKGVYQHSGFSWQIQGKQFIEADFINEDSQALDTAFKSWLTKVDLTIRENAVNAFFSIFAAAKIEHLDDLSDKSLSHVLLAFKELKNMDSDSRNALIQFFKTLIIENNNSRKENKKKNND